MGRDIWNPDFNPLHADCNPDRLLDAVSKELIGIPRFRELKEPSLASSTTAKRKKTKAGVLFVEFDAIPTSTATATQTNAGSSEMTIAVDLEK